MRFESEIVFTKDEFDRWNQLFEYEAETQEEFENKFDIDKTEDARDCKFENGYEADLKLCAGQTNFFIDLVLFAPDKDGSFSDVCCDCLDGLCEDDYEFEVDDDIYVVKVRITKNESF